MTRVPDGIEVVATAEQAAQLESPPLLIVANVEEYLDAQGIGSGPISWSRIGDGQSNVTYQIERGDDRFVLRRGPRPPLPKSTHDMAREALIQQLVKKQGVAVPEVLAVCTDTSVLGVPFYLMEFVPGTVVTDVIPPELDSASQRRATSLAAVDQLARLHQLRVDTGDLASFGRPEGYLKRQVSRFLSLWSDSTSRDLPEVARIGTWLQDNAPASQASSVVHGDYRLGNLMFAPEAPAQVIAILDWEMAALGDPLADLGYFIATYTERGSLATPLELSPVTRASGYLTRPELIRRYQEQIPLELDALPWYEALAMWKAAIFCEAIYTRWVNGERPEDLVFGPSLATGVPALLAAADRSARML